MSERKQNIINRVLALSPEKIDLLITLAQRIELLSASEKALLAKHITGLEEAENQN